MKARWPKCLEEKIINLGISILISDTSDSNGLSREILHSKWIDQTDCAALNHILAIALVHDFILEKIGSATNTI